MANSQGTASAVCMFSHHLENKCHCSEGGKCCHHSKIQFTSSTPVCNACVIQLQPARSCCTAQSTSGQCLRYGVIPRVHPEPRLHGAFGKRLCSCQCVVVSRDYRWSAPETHLHSHVASPGQNRPHQEAACCNNGHRCCLLSNIRGWLQR